MEKLPDLYNLAIDCSDKHAASLINKHKTALIFCEQIGGEWKAPLKLSYDQLTGLSNRMANALQSLGIEKGQRVLLRLANSVEFVISFLGAVKAGAIPIPTSPLLTEEELQFLITDSGATTLITTPELVIESPQNKSLQKIILITEKNTPLPPQTHRWQDLLKTASAQFETKPTAANSPAFWLYTSGTTGKPKAVIHAHRSIRAHDERAKFWQDVKMSDVIFNTSALNWSYALTAGALDIWRHGLSSVVFNGKPTPENLSRIIAKFGVTTLMSVPGIYRRLNIYLKENPDAFRGVRVCTSAGESLSKKVREEFKQYTGLDIYEGLGMTEHSVYLVQRFGETPKQGSVGHPLPGHQIKILREDLSETEPGETGTLASHQSCEGLMLGYWDHKGTAYRALTGDWFLSGDLAYRDQEGDYFFVGRKDDMITAGGYRISPLEVEEVLNHHPWIQESAVTGAKLEEEKTIVQAHVVLKKSIAEHDKTEDKLLAYCAEYLAKYKIPRRIIFIEALPKTITGKIKREELI